MKTFFSLGIATSILFCSFQPALAANLQNTEYNLEVDDINTIPTSKVFPTPLKPTPTTETQAQKKPKITEKPKHTELSRPIRFSISPTLLDFGPLSATEPITRTSILSVLGTSQQGYSILGYESSPLIASDSAIPNTTCDNGSCSLVLSAPWINNLTYGFGYRCDNLRGTNCRGFDTQTHFKQFANVQIKQLPQAVLEEATVNGENKSQVTYKVNISATTKPQQYKNTIYYILVPNY